MDWVAWVMGCSGVAFVLFAEGLIQHGQHGKTGIGGGGEEWRFLCLGFF